KQPESGKQPSNGVESGIAVPPLVVPDETPVVPTPDDTGSACGDVVQSGRALQASSLESSKHCLSVHDDAASDGQLHGPWGGQPQPPPVPNCWSSQRLSALHAWESSALHGSIGCATA